MSYITFQKLTETLKVASETEALRTKLNIAVNPDRESLQASIAGWIFVSRQWGSIRFQNEIKIASLTARNKLRTFVPSDLQLSGLGPITAQNIDFLHHYITDFREISTLAVIKARIANPWLCGMYSTAIALTRYVKAHQMEHKDVKLLLRSSNWRWIRMDNGDYVQQTLYTKKSNITGLIKNVNLGNVDYYNEADATSIVDLTPFASWVINVYDAREEAFHEEREAEALREATRLFSHSDRAEQHFEFKKGKKPAYTTYMGIELELENHHVHELPTLHTIKNHCIFKRDGSLNNGVELCSAPATMDLHLEAFKTFFDAHQANKSHLKAMETCGMHIHVDKSKLSRLHIANIALFMNLAENDAAINKIAGREANRYCKRENQTYYNFVINRHHDRYTRINFTNERTIEFRLFASTTNYTDFAKRVEFTQAVIDYTRPGETNLSCKDIPKWMNFTQYVMSHRKHYPTFVKECL